MPEWNGSGVVTAMGDISIRPFKQTCVIDTEGWRKAFTYLTKATIRHDIHIAGMSTYKQILHFNENSVMHI